MGKEVETLGSYKGRTDSIFFVSLSSWFFSLRIFPDSRIIFLYHIFISYSNMFVTRRLRNVTKYLDGWEFPTVACYSHFYSMDSLILKL